MEFVKVTGALLFLLFLSSCASGMPAHPGVRNLTQPDGTIVQARAFGDEYGGWVVTLEGYTIVQDSIGWWTYAVLDDGVLEPSSARAGEGFHPGIQGFRKHLQPRRSSRIPPALEAEGWRAARSPAPSPGAQGVGVQYLSNGTQRGLLILVNFTDSYGVNASKYTVGWYDNLLLNQSNNRSMWRYYNETSYGQLDVNVSYANNGMWLTSAYNHTYWGNDTGPNSSNPGTFDDGFDCIYNLAREAMILADPYVDYSAFDINSNGRMENSELMVFVVHAGEGQEATYPSGSDNIWSHKNFIYGAGYLCSTCATYIFYSGIWTLCNNTFLDGVLVTRNSTADADMMSYAMLAEDSPMGTFAHEFGHTMGLPDLYDPGSVGGTSWEGIGSWGIMAAGGWCGPGSPSDGTVPCHLSAWSKYFLG